MSKTKIILSVLIVIFSVIAYAGDAGAEREMTGVHPVVSAQRDSSGLRLSVDSSWTIRIPCDTAFCCLVEEYPFLKLKGNHVEFKILVDYSDNHPIEKRSKGKETKVQLDDTAQLFLDSREVFTYFADTLLNKGKGGYTVFPEENVLKKFEMDEEAVVIAYMLRIHNRYTLFAIAVIKKENLENSRKEMELFENGLLNWTIGMN